MKIETSVSNRDAAIILEMFEKGEFGDLVANVELSQSESAVPNEGQATNDLKPDEEQARAETLQSQPAHSDPSLPYWRRLSYRRTLGGMSIACSLAMLFPIWAPPAYVAGLILSVAAGVMAYRSRANYALPAIGTLLNGVAIILWPMAFGLFPVPQGYLIKYGDRRAAAQLADEKPAENASGNNSTLIVMADSSERNLTLGENYQRVKEITDQILGKSDKDEKRKPEVIDYGGDIVSIDGHYFKVMRPSKEEMKRNLEAIDELKKEAPDIFKKDSKSAPQLYEMPSGQQRITIKDGDEMVFDRVLTIPPDRQIICVVSKASDGKYTVKFIPPLFAE